MCTCLHMCVCMPVREHVCLKIPIFLAIIFPGIGDTGLGGF